MLTSTLHTIYPRASWRKNQLLLYARLGMDTNVSTDVSVATMENMATHQGVFFPAKK